MTSAAKVLVVDDHKPTRDFVFEALQDDGYLVRTAADAHQALAAIESERYDAILLDLRMPVIDGRDLFRLLYERNLATMPIILMTADSKAMQELVSQGVRFILFKPFDLDTLLSCVEEALRAPQSAQKQGIPVPADTTTQEVHICS
jgi:DNA-binding response OmpR family regulator